MSVDVKIDHKIQISQKIQKIKVLEEPVPLQYQVKLVSKPSSKLGKYLIKLIYIEILTRHRVGVNSAIKEQVLTELDGG